MIHDKDLLSIQEVRDKVDKAYKAWLKYRNYSQQQVDAIVEAMAAAGRANARRLAEWAVSRADHLILSDDYFTLACFEMLKVESIRVWHLGVPADGLPAHGPLATDKVRELIAGDPVTVKI